MSEKRRRVRMSAILEPTPIIDPDNQDNFLGRFIAGGEYWITEKNASQIEDMLRDGRCREIDPNKPYRDGPLAIGAKDGTMTGTIEIKD